MRFGNLVFGRDVSTLMLTYGNMRVWRQPTYFDAVVELRRVSDLGLNAGPGVRTSRRA